MALIAHPAARCSCAKHTGYLVGAGTGQSGHKRDEGGYPYKVEACDFEEHASTFGVVGPALFGDNWGKWWITRGLG